MPSWEDVAEQEWADLQAENERLRAIEAAAREYVSAEDAFNGAVDARHPDAADYACDRLHAARAALRQALGPLMVAWHWCTHQRGRPGYVAVWTVRGQGDWHWSKVERAKPEHIIRCAMCGQPAVQVDHLFPYESYYCRCADHIRTEQEAR